MIKIVFCLRRKPSLSPEEFYRYWLESHGPLVRQHAPALRIRRYTQGHTFTDPRVDPAVDARGCEVEPYDGIAELWFDDLASFRSARDERASTASAELLEDERRFIHLPASPIWLGEELAVVGEVTGASVSQPRP